MTTHTQIFFKWGHILSMILLLVFFFTLKQAIPPWIQPVINLIIRMLSFTTELHHNYGMFGVCAHTDVQMGTHACGDQSSTSGGITQEPLTLVSVLKPDLWLAWTFQSGPGWLNNKPQGPVSTSPDLGLHHHHTLLFCMDSGDQTRVLIFVWQALYRPSYLAQHVERLHPCFGA